MLAQLKKGLFMFLAATVLSVASGSGLVRSATTGRKEGRPNHESQAGRQESRRSSGTVGARQDSGGRWDAGYGSPRPTAKARQPRGAALLRVLFAKNGEVRDVRVLPDPHLGIHFKIVRIRAK